MNIGIIILLIIFSILLCYSLKKKLMRNKFIKEENQTNEKLNKLSDEQKKDNDKKFYENIDTYKKDFYMLERDKAYENLLKNLKNDSVIYTKTKLHNCINEIQSYYSFSYDEKRTIRTVLTMKEKTLDNVINVYIKIKNKKRNKLDSFDITAINAICEVSNIKVSEKEIKNKIKKFKVNNINHSNSPFQKKDKSTITTFSKSNKQINKELLRDQVIKELEQTKNILNKENIYILMDKFIITNTQKFDDESMSLEEYMNKINDFIEFLKYKNLIENIINIDIMYFNYILEERKWTIYIKNLKDKINLTEKDSKEHIVSTYVDFYGNNSTNTININTLSKILNIPNQQALMLVETEKHKISKEHKIKEFEKELFQNSKITINDIDKFNGYEFEDFLSSLFNSFGYKVQQTPYSGDYGADLIIEKNEKKIAVQAKNYSGNVGLEAVQQALSGKSYYKCNFALVITNAYFTRQAIQLAESSKVQLIDREKLISMLEEGINLI